MSINSATVANTITLTLLLPLLSLNSLALTDPTKPEQYQPVASMHQPLKERKLHLNMIINRGQDSIVIINNEQLSIGDSIAGVKLIQVAEDTVTMLDQGKTLTLKLLNKQHHRLSISRP